MVALEVCYCFKSKERMKIEDVDVTHTVSQLKEVLNERFCGDLGLTEIIYCGMRLQNEATLSSVGIKNGSTVYVVNSLQSEPNDLVLDASIELSILSSIKSTLAKPSNKSIIDRILHDPAALESLIEATPGLGSDPVTLSLLRDPSILSQFCKPEMLRKVLKKHPSFGHACLYLASEVQADIVQSGQAKYGGSYSLDEMSDDEDTPSPHLARDVAEATGQITTDQLMAALASAQNLASPAPQAPSAESAPAAGSALRTRLTSSFLHDAMRQAHSSITSPLTSSNTSPVQTLEAQLTQLRDMGITDELGARNALEATGGDIHAALELLFGGHSDDM